MIKSKIVSEDKKEQGFPKLMKYLNHSDEGCFVILVTDQCSNYYTATVVSSDNYERPIGDYSDKWCVSSFRNFTDIIQLSNKEL